jgi:hypothetical protein
MTDHPFPGPAPEQPLQQVQHASATARVPDQIGRGVFATGVIVLRGPNEYAIDFVQSLARPSRVAARVVLSPPVAGQFVIALEQAIEKYTATFGQPPHEPRPVPPPQAGGMPSGAAGDPGSQGGQPMAQPQPALEQGAAHPAVAGAAGGGLAAGSPSPPQPGPPQPVVPQPPPQQPPIAEVYETLKLPDEMLGGTYANMASITHTASEFCFDFIAQFFPRSAVTARVYMAAPRAVDLLGSLKRSIGGR